MHPREGRSRGGRSLVGAAATHSSAARCGFPHPSRPWCSGGIRPSDQGAPRARYAPPRAGPSARHGRRPPLPRPEAVRRARAPALPGSPRTWTQASGVAEFASPPPSPCRATRRTGGLLAAGLFAAVFPANVKMAYDWRHRPAPLKAVAYARLPVQAPLVIWALKVSRSAAAGSH